MRLFVFSRHGQSTLNVARRINGDPSVPANLTGEGRAAARALGVQVAGVPLEVCVHSRFARTLQTAEAALGGRDVPFVEEPLLDDVNLGDLEGRTIDEYRAWKEEHSRADCFPGGESLDDCARRYGHAFRNLASRPESSALVVCHEIPIRYLLNAAAGSADLDGPVHEILNATPYLVDDDTLLRAADRIDELVGASAGERT